MWKEREIVDTKHLETALIYWAADREGVASFAISDVHLVFDKGWAGTDVTPGDPAEIFVNYKVTRTVSEKIPFDKVTEFIATLCEVAGRVRA